jgi:hypothetical protein
MGIDELLKKQGWELKQRQGWISVWDRRPGFDKISSSGRVAKIIGGNFFVVPQQLASATSRLAAEANAPLKKAKSTNNASDAVYVGIDTAAISPRQLETFVTGLRAAIDELILD